MVSPGRPGMIRIFTSHILKLHREYTLCCVLPSCSLSRTQTYHHTNRTVHRALFGAKAGGCTRLPVVRLEPVSVCTCCRACIVHVCPPASTKRFRCAVLCWMCKVTGVACAPTSAAALQSCTMDTAQHWHLKKSLVESSPQCRVQIRGASSRSMMHREHRVQRAYQGYCMSCVHASCTVLAAPHGKSCMPHMHAVRLSSIPHQIS